MVVHRGMRKKPTHDRGETYWVKAHERRYPSAAKPHWIAYRINDGHTLVRVDGPNSMWTSSVILARTFLKRSLPKQFENEINAGDIRLFKVD